MDSDKVVNDYFIDEFKDANDFQDIMAYMDSLGDKLVIEYGNISNLDCAKRKNNPDYKVDLKIEKIENGIKVPYLFRGMDDLIKRHIPQSIESVKIPRDLIDKIDYKRNPNIKEILSDDYLNIEDIQYISENSDIKKVNSPFLYYDLENKGINVVYNNKIMIYDDIVVNNPNKEEPDYLKIISDTTNQEKLDKMFEKIDLNNYKEINAILENNRINIEKVKDKNVLTDKGDISIVTDAYKFFDKKIGIDKVKFSIEQQDENFDKSKIEYTSLDYKDLDEIAKKVEIEVGYDSSYVTKGPYEEFRGLVESLKWYRKIITDYPLSPVEKLGFAYDILKTFNYKESEIDPGDSRDPSRIIATGNIVCAGYTNLLNEIMYGIDPNIKSDQFGLTCYEDDDETLLGFHSRSVVEVDDDKYNIHGIYALDPTWDSYKDVGKEVLGEDYDALSLYHYFMIPFNEYAKVFKHDSSPKFFEGKLASLNDDFSLENINKEIVNINNEEKEVKEDDSISTKDNTFEISTSSNEENVYDYDFPEEFAKGKTTTEVLNKFAGSRRLDFKEFLEIVRNVRMAEGYQGNLLDEEVNKVARINSRYYGIDSSEMEFQKQ